MTNAEMQEIATPFQAEEVKVSLKTRNGCFQPRLSHFKTVR
jgi:hypothetical protein